MMNYPSKIGTKSAEKPKNVKYIWRSMPYLNKSIWTTSITKEKKLNCRRFNPHGVIVKDLPENHVLYGEKGLFASKIFKTFEIVGEYTGRVICDDVFGEYVALLEDKPPNFNALGVDAMNCGNEMRFINSFFGIASQANLTMRTVYIESYPHLVLVCIRDIGIGEEFLLDYGDAYHKEYLIKKEKVLPYSSEELQEILPFSDNYLEDFDEKILCDNEENIEELSNQVISPSPIWAPEGNIKYTNSNWWSPSISHQRKEASLRTHPMGVEVRNLPSTHFLHGERGLFATMKFSKYDIIGEYTGKIVDVEMGGHYCAALEDKPTKESIGVDAIDCGNEMRFINSYFNVASEPNVSFQTVYINTYPHLLIVCTKSIEIGEEFLLDYGEAYNNAYLCAKVPVESFNFDDIKDVLPFFGNNNDDDDDSNNDV